MNPRSNSNNFDSRLVGFIAVLLFLIQASPVNAAWPSTELRPLIGQSLWAGTYGQSKYVVVGGTVSDGGSIASSANGLNWRPVNFGAPLPILHDIIHAENLFVAVGGDGAIVTSPDALAWTPRTSGTVETLYAVAHDGARFIAVGEGGTILGSSDGISWVPRVSGVASQLYGVIYAAGKFVVVGGAIDAETGALSDVALTSSDGVTWMPASAGSSSVLVNVAHGGGKYVAVGSDGSITSSPDGSTWTPRVSGTSETLLAVIHDGTRFIAMGAAGTLLTSLDAAAWTAATLPTPATITDIFQVSGQLIATGVGALWFSNDGLNWGALRGVPISSAFGAGRYVAVGLDGGILSSLDAMDWRPTGSPTELRLNKIIHAEGIFVAVGNVGTVLTSLDGIDWNPQFSGVTSVLNDVAHNGTNFVTVGTGGTILYSPSGTIWVPAVSSTLESLTSVSYGNGFFIAVGRNGMILSSADGVSWTRRYPLTSEDLFAVRFAGNRFVVAGTNGIVLVSTDTISWFAGSSGSTDLLGGGGIAHACGWFITTTQGESVLASYDGYTWYANTIRPGTGWFGLGGFGDFFQAFGVNLATSTYQLARSAGDCASGDFDNDGIPNDHDLRSFSPRALAQDLNGDDVVDAIDLGIMMSNWGLGTSWVDLSGNGNVGNEDMSILIPAMTP